MFINIFSLIMIAFIIISIYFFINNDNVNVGIEKFTANDNQKIPKNNFTKQFLDRESSDNIKLNKLVKSKEKITPCCGGGYYVPGNFGFNFN